MGKIESKNSLKSEKDELRRHATERRRKIADSIGFGVAPERLTTHFVNFIDPQPNTAISAYWPFRNEIDVRPLLQRLSQIGCNCFLPVILGPGEPLEFRQWRPGDTLIKSRFGTFEPSDCYPKGVPELLVIPLLAFDTNGHRLGYGGGYFDRTIEMLRGDSNVVAVGVAYGAQQVDKVPQSQFDQQLDAIITEESIFRVSDI